MPDLNDLPPVQEEDVEIGRGDEVREMQSSSQEVAMAACGSETRGEEEVHSEQSSSQEAVVPEDKSEDIIMIDQPSIDKHNRGESSDTTGEVQLTSPRITRSASKRQRKTVEDVAVVLPSFKSGLQDTKNELAASKNDLKEAKAQLSGKKKDLAACRRDLQESKSLSRYLKKTNDDLQKTLKAYQEELSKCKDDLFSLQGVAQTPDSVITQRFESISQQIVNWIDTEIANYARANPGIDPDHVFSGSEQKRVTDFLQRHPGTGEHVARYVIHRLLQYHVFGNTRYFVGLPQETARLLQEAESGFAKLDPPRGMYIDPS